MMSTRSTEQGRSTGQQDQDLTCGVCGRSFTRYEHLRRHEFIHSNEKPHQCDICGREFVRKDALDRHLATHQGSGASLRRKGARACMKCATAKAKCSGEVPRCSRCVRRGEETCQYPDMPVATYEITATGQDICLQINTSDDAELRPISQPHHNGIRSATSIPISQTMSQTSLSELLPVEPNNQAGWDDNFSSTINWLTNETPIFPDSFGFDNFTDVALFPYLNASGEGGDELYNPSPLQQNFASPHQHETRLEFPKPHPRHKGSISISSGSTPSSTLVAHEVGELYVDDQPGRLPRVKRRKLNTSSFAGTPKEIDVFDLNFDCSEIPGEMLEPQFNLYDETYEEICKALNKICFRDETSMSLQNQELQPSATEFMSHVFSTRFKPGRPTKLALEMMVQSYVTSFQPVLPILHVTDFQNLPWQLVLAMAALGARFLNLEPANVCFAASLHEFLRRILYIGEENPGWLPSSSAAQAQVRLLFTIGLSYTSSSQRWNGRHPVDFLPISFCNRLWCQPPRPRSRTHASHSAQTWEEWRTSESNIRLGYAIWLIDCLFAVHFRRRPLLALGDVSSCLPCHEELWNMQSAESWSDVKAKFSPTKPINEVLHHLYVKKHLSPELGEFSRILLIHGLFHRMWQVQSYFVQPLSQWTPTAPHSSDESISADSPLWPPSVPTYAKWRNATCDCIDVLHWSANATIGAASGMEHSTVLHLHFSRVVLLSPYEHIVALAEHLVNRKGTMSETETKINKQFIRRWAVQDQYKARLAMIHAGVLLWHVRRYSVNGFYEPTSVALATLALWAFSIFAEKPQVLQNDGAVEQTPLEVPGDNDEQEARCEIILLDRPTDDELVQQFVREGHQMRAILKGVGDLCGSSGAERVLMEGRKLLKSLTLWGVAENWLRLFDDLIAISRQGKE